MINNNKNPSNCCKFCGWEFHQDILQRIIDNTQPVLCEFCGIELNISNVNVKTEVSKAKNEKTDDRDKETDHKKRATTKNFKKWISPQKYARNVIDRDDEFPLIFKDNLIIVVSRLIYFAITKWEEENNISIHRVSLEKAIQIYIIQMIKPILDKRVPSTFLINLFKLNKEDFEEWLKLLQKKMALNEEYRTHFKYYLNWLIKIVFDLVSNKWEMNNLPRFQATILKDLKLFLTSFSSKEKCNNSEYLDLSENNLIITNSFRGNLYKELREMLYDLITRRKVNYQDFNSEEVIIGILRSLHIPATYNEIDIDSKIIDKKTRKLRLKNKKIYISVLGKIMIDILDFSKNDSITDISDRYNVSRDFVTKTAKFLSMKHNFKLKDRFPTTSARGFGFLPSNKTLEELDFFSRNYEDPKLLKEIGIIIFSELITGSKILKVDELPLGFKTNPRYLAISLTYYALRHIKYNITYPKYRNYGIKKFILENFPNNTTMSLAITNIVPKLYNFLSDGIKSEILYSPLIKDPKKKYSRTGFIKKLNLLYDDYIKSDRLDSCILIELIKSTLNHYHSGQFHDFINDLKFWTNQNKAWYLLKKLSIPDTLRRRSDLKDFIKKYNELIKRLNIDKKDKQKLRTILKNFEKNRVNQYKEKKRREYERYLTYGEYFFDPKTRIKRFLLLLGFSPYDGFDIWENRISIKGKLKIFANFHHYHYDSEDQSENDLVFIPVKPPKKIRTKIYQEKRFLTHHMISGREGHLKKKITSPKKKLQIQKDLKEIEEQIEYNSELIEKAVLTFDSDLLNNLLLWPEKQINKAKLRLLDNNFTWAKGIEKAIPLTKKHNNYKINPRRVREIIKEILEERIKNIES